jgi:hypothetical protein
MGQLDEAEKRRKDHRFHVEFNIAGTFKNNEKFLLKDINFEGLKLLVGFSPLIGSKYNLTLENNDQSEDFHIKVVRVEPGGYNADEESEIPLGALYSVGAQILNMTESKRRFVMDLLYHQK